MTSNKPLDAIWQSYLESIDCFKVASRCISAGDTKYLKNTEFLNEKVGSAEEEIARARKNADDFVILSLWAVFERLLLDEIQNESKKMLKASGSTFTSKVFDKIEKEVEYWRTDDVLDLFKGRVDSNLIGNTKQIKQYRDWVAHRNKNKIPTQNITPEMAYKILSTVTNEFNSIIA